MFLITIAGREQEGAYAAIDEYGEYILYIFEEEDDAVRFAMLLEEDDYPEMHVLEVDEDLIKKACSIHDYQYRIFTKNDIVIPPQTNDNDFI